MISIVRTLAVCLIVLGGQFTPSHSNVINFDPPSGGTNDGRQLQNAQPPPPAFLSPPVLNVVNGTISPLDQHFLVMVYNESLQANNATEAASNSTDPRLFPLSVVQPIYLQQLKDIIKNKTLLNALLPGFFPPISRDPTSSTISIRDSHETSSTTLESIINSLDPSLQRPTSAAGPATTGVDTFSTTAGLRYLDITKCGVFPACSVDPKVDEKGDTILVTCHRPVVGLLVAITIILAIVIVLSNLLIIIVTLRTRSL
uniref:Uncharacterized protein n=1 Tax=Ciona savignyi TaxID=51511 RepID=H2Z281_CIOSA